MGTNNLFWLVSTVSTRYLSSTEGRIALGNLNILCQFIRYLMHRLSQAAALTSTLFAVDRGSAASVLFRELCQSPFPFVAFVVYSNLSLEISACHFLLLSSDKISQAAFLIGISVYKYKCRLALKAVFYDRSRLPACNNHLNRL